jgi:hypothetical protein
MKCLLILLTSLTAVLVGCTSNPSAPAGASEAEFPKLAGVKRVCIGNLGNEDGSALLREKLRLELSKSPRFTVVGSLELADAVLIGTAAAERRYPADEGNLETHFAGVGIFRLVELQTQETVWTFEYKRGVVAPGNSPSSRVAGQVVERLLRDTAAADSNAHQ